MSDAEYGVLMLEKASQDLRTLRGLHKLSVDDPESIDDDAFGFHAQQAVEKAMKALISFKQREFSLTHDLAKLADELREAGEDPAAFNVSVDLNPFAVQQRYPLAGIVHAPLDRAQLLAEVEAILARVDATLKGSDA